MLDEKIDSLFSCGRGIVRVPVHLKHLTRVDYLGVPDPPPEPLTRLADRQQISKCFRGVLGVHVLFGFANLSAAHYE